MHIYIAYIELFYVKPTRITTAQKHKKDHDLAIMYGRAGHVDMQIIMKA